MWILFLQVVLGDAQWERALFNLYNRARDSGQALLLSADENGDFVTATELGGFGSSAVADLSIDATSGEMFVVGRFSGTLDVEDQSLTSGPSASTATFFARFFSDLALPT